MREGNPMLRKLFTTASLVALSGVFASGAMAGGQEVILPTYSGIYLEVNLGYAHIDWRNYALGIPNFGGPLSTSISNTLGGFSAGANIGYQFNEYWAFEAGWYYLPKVRGTTPTPPSVSPFVDVKATAWFAYFAGKLMLPIYQDTYIFAKIGGAYRETRLSADAAFLNPVTGQPLPIRGRYWVPLFGAGIQYYITPNWSLNAQYVRIPGYQRAIAATTRNRLNVPAANILTAGVGYKFLI